jgi:hypothetical protein
MPNSNDKNEDVIRLLMQDFVSRLVILSNLSDDIKADACGLMAAETLASLFRRHARDAGVSKETVEQLRVDASNVARDWYEESGVGPVLRTRSRAQGVADDTAFSDAEKRAAEKVALEAITRALRQKKES